ncbi:hypothetical protein ARHIZOSPH14_19380 [Agromyces rhizosphaerae]|uniref:Uncharacterized protein n=1 Tax=Agromyces rhizosphaerae TaxID=88374 RepID=A0A9W6CX95_9MICO|nr:MULTISPECIES: hypothetical protein [Agromyces]GLI27696.1 hypothetical protein ARHIZOSPH14_19380 [Agromyces rhizosphaerae]
MSAETSLFEPTHRGTSPWTNGAWGGAIATTGPVHQPTGAVDTAPDTRLRIWHAIANLFHRS